MRFKRRKLGICPNPPQISTISKPVFFSSKCGDFKTLFFSPPGNVAIFIFFENFPKCSLHHVCFHGGLSNGFWSQKINK
jgi:hypothetical protein